MPTVGQLTTLSFDSTSLIDNTNYFCVIPDLDSEAEQTVPVIKGHHTRPAFGLPTFEERVLTANCFIVPTNGVAGFSDFDSKLDTLKKLLDTSAGTKVLVVQRQGFAARYLNCHTRQFAINRIERKFSWQFVAADPVWRSVTPNTDSQNITADGQTWTLTNNGTHDALPIFTITPTSANTNTWNYHKRIILRNPMTETAIPAGYWYDITNGGLDTATLVSGGKMQSDGDDVRVVFRGQDIPRYLQSFNTSSTKIWIRFPVPLPKATVDGLGGEWSDDSDNLAPGTRDNENAVTATGTVSGNHVAKHVLATSWDDDGNPDEPYTHRSWLVTTTSATIFVDLQSATTVNRVRLLHLPNNQAAKDFTIETSNNASSWTTQVTVTNNTAQGKYTTHDFTDNVSCRYVRVSITSAQGGARVGLNKFMVFRAHHHLTLRYGNATASSPQWHALLSDTHTTSSENPLLPANSIAFQPMFNPSTSSNTLHVYDDFTDNTPQGRFRTMQWEARNHYKDPLGKAYKGGQNAGTGESTKNPSAALGVTQVNAGVGHADTWQIHEPCGIVGLNHSGDVKNTVKYYAWRQLSKARDEHTPIEDWRWSYPVTNWTAYNSYYFSYDASDEQQTKYFIFFNLARVGADPSGTKHYGQVRKVNLQLVTGNVPICTIGAEDGARVSFGGTIVNTATRAQQSIEFEVEHLPLGESVEIDCYNKTIRRMDTRKSLLSALKISSPRMNWMHLKPGANLMRYDESGMVAVTVATSWSDAWL